MNEQIVEEIAIIGMAGAFPGANNIHEFWINLIQKRESVTTLTAEELTQAGVLPSEWQDPSYVARGGFLENAECFDNEFFKISPREAEIMDPQHRVLLEQSWLALEDAGYISDELEVPVGVFVGSSVNRYLARKNDWRRSQSVSEYQIMLANEKDFLSTRISYKLNLKGPSVNVQSACSTSLLAVGLACKSLLNYECDMALAGGVTVTAPRERGYIYQEGMIFSKQGRCRPFDVGADGTIFGEGVGVVCLKRVSEALEDGDHIYAVIKSVGINNDGSGKIGFTAPSIDGQADVVRLAQALADVNPSDIGFVETHGTGTLLGDSVEIAALKEAFKDDTGRQGNCYLGALKANLGHLDAAAGVAALIKATLVVKEGIIPPAINFDTPNPDLGLENSPFCINKESVQWASNGRRRRAGVSSFGMGGTNVHAIIEQPPEAEYVPTDRSEVVLLSARGAGELENYKKNLKEYLLDENEFSLNDIAWTLRECRKPFQYRWSCSARSKKDLIEKLEDQRSYNGKSNAKKVVFLYPGQGAQFSGMAATLYGYHPTFTQWIDRGIEFAQPFFGESISDLLLKEGNDEILLETRISQPVLFILELALSQELLVLGIKPDRLCGHSLGEYMAACVAGVLTFEDALHLVIKRADLMHKAPKGAMLAVPLSKNEIQSLLPQNLCISAYNSNNQQVVSGEVPAVEAFELALKGKGVRCVRLKISHAFHSPLIEEILTDFSKELDGISFQETSIPLVSNISGTWVEDKNNWQDYWVHQLRNPVRFSDCLDTLCKDESVFIEVGPGVALSTFVQTNDPTKSSVTFPCLIHNTGSGNNSLQESLVTLWQYGCEIHWKEWVRSNGKRVPLPGYPFEKKSFWILSKGTTSDIINAELQNNKPCGTIALVNGPIRNVVTQVWQNFFGISDIPLDQDFFSLGGDSLMGSGLVEEINSRLQLKLTFGELVLHPTLGGLIEYISGCNKNQLPEYQFPVLFPVQPRGERPPLFLVAGAHANRYFDIKNMKSSYEDDFLSYFSMLVGSLGMDQPVYGFRPKGLLLGEEPHASVEVMANHYIQALKEIQPQGPYFIGGECIGGVVAYKMAVQLQNAGENVAQLIMMDTPRPTFLFQVREEYRYLKQNIKKGIKDALLYLRSTERGRWKEDALPWVSLLLSVVLPLTKNQRIKRRVVIGSYQYWRRLLRYRPKGYKGRVTFIVNEQWNQNRFLLGWRKELGTRVSIEVVPGGI